MEVSIYKDHDTLSSHAAGEIIGMVARKPDAVLCLATGDTPRLTYSLVVQQATARKVDFTRCTFIGLDEWVGISPENEGSCHYFLRHHIFAPLQIAPHQIHLFNALSGDLAGECGLMNRVVKQRGGIDLMLVGIGMNGHIGFNEPGVAPDQYAHVVTLDEGTRTVGQKYFREQTVLTEGITLGLKHVLEAEKVLLLANGVKKAEVVRRALEEEVTTALPASIIRKHANSRVMLDEPAASALTRGETKSR